MKTEKEIMKLIDDMILTNRFHYSAFKKKGKLITAASYADKIIALLELQVAILEK